MHRSMRVLVTVVMLAAGAGAARAQLIDPSTGFMVDPSTDPMDFSAVASGQPGNIGMEASAAAMSQIQAQQAAMSAQQSQAFQDADSNVSQQSAENTVPARPAQAKTPAPKISPNGGKVQSGSFVTIEDADTAAVVYFTTDGSTPTAGSSRYRGPIVVSRKEKVRAMAFDVNDAPSDIASKTFKIKS